MFNLKVDSENKNIKIELMLKGEVEPLIIEIDNYSIVEEEEKIFIDIKHINTNREWLNVIINTYIIKNHKIEIPKKYASLLDIVF